jgi:uncharacterized damage-inducible protein DinB
MSEIEKVVEQLRRAFEGNAWHGPAMREILADVTAPGAAAKPLAEAHSIWDIVLHMTVWEDVVRRRLHGIIQHDLYHAGQIAVLKKASR